MKTNLLLTLAFSLFTGFAALANNPGKDLITPTDEEAAVTALVTPTHFAHKAYIPNTDSRKLNVFIRKAGCTPVDLMLKDSDGHALYAKTFTADTVRQPFNLRNLEAGVYTLELRRGSQVEVQSFEVK